MNIIIKPMFAGLLGIWEMVIILAVLFFVIAVPVVVVAIVYFATRKSKAKPQPVRVPVSPANPPPPPAKTEVMSRQCPQCGAALKPDAPEGLCPACLLQRGFATEAGAPAGAGAFTPPPITELVQLFPQLEIIACLGRGGMGAVYKARQPRLDRFVALKILAPEKQNDPQFAERFEREARVLARLSHPNIVSVFDFGEVQGRFYLLMEFVDGLTLRQVMQAGKISPAEALALIPKICDALQYAHGQGIVHRDIKPENILIDKQGGVKIADFGIAKIAGVEAQGLGLTGARDVMGTPHYMAPEQVEKPQSVDHRADIYSLGVVFYEMLTGELPLGKFPLPSKKAPMDVRLDDVVLHALEKEPDRRYQEASQVKTAVETIAGTPAPSATPLTPKTTNSGNVSTALVTAPAVALMVAGALKVFQALTVIWLIVPIIYALMIIPAALIIYGGYQMLQRRSYTWSVAAGIIAIVSCSLISFPIGIWALVVLARSDVKSLFGIHQPEQPAATQSSRFWRYFAVIGCAGVVLLAVVFISGLAFVMSRHASMESTLQRSLPGMQGMPFVTLPNSIQPFLGNMQINGETQKKTTQAFEFNPTGQFALNNLNGRIEIHGWDSNSIVINTTIRGKTPASVEAVKFEYHETTNNISILTQLPAHAGNHLWNWLWFRDANRDEVTVDYVVQAPSHAQLEKISNLNGPVVIDGMAGDVCVATANGNIEVKDAAANLDLCATNGNISADMSQLDKGQLVLAEAHNGQITLAVPEAANAAISAQSVNGDIKSGFASLAVTKQAATVLNLEGNLGHGDAHVTLGALNGEIKIQKHIAITPAISPLSYQWMVNPSGLTNSAVTISNQPNP